VEFLCAGHAHKHVSTSTVHTCGLCGRSTGNYRVFLMVVSRTCNLVCQSASLPLKQMAGRHVHVVTSCHAPVCAAKVQSTLR
jgi:hypothetical protein